MVSLPQKSLQAVVKSFSMTLWKRKKVHTWHHRFEVDAAVGQTGLGEHFPAGELNGRKCEGLIFPDGLQLRSM